MINSRTLLGLFALALLMVGCVAMLPNLRETHPRGMEAVLKIAPECGEPSLSTYRACEAAAQIMEAPPRKAIVLLLGHVEKALGAMDAEIEKSRRNGDMITRVSFESSRKEQIEIANRVVVAAANAALVTAGKEDLYAVTMLRHIELLMIDSPSSRESLRSAHVATMEKADAATPASAAAPSVAPAADAPKE